MRTIQQLALSAADVTLSMIKGAVPIHGHMTNDAAVIVFFDCPVTESEEKELRRFICFHSAQEIPADWDLDYLFSVANNVCARSLHVFERKDELRSPAIALL